MKVLKMLFPPRSFPFISITNNILFTTLRRRHFNSKPQQRHIICETEVALSSKMCVTALLQTREAARIEERQQR